MNDRRLAYLSMSIQIAYLCVLGSICMKTAFDNSDPTRPQLSHEDQAVAGYFLVAVAGILGTVWYAQAPRIAKSLTIAGIAGFGASLLVIIQFDRLAMPSVGLLLSSAALVIARRATKV